MPSVSADRVPPQSADAPRADRIPEERSCEVLVIGGGPAGSTLAGLLAERGRDVVLLEKSRHPRFHIGESLLPLNMPLFDRLGVGEEIARIGMPKYGVEFVSPWHGKSMFFEFADAWDKAFPSSYQVRRSDFDAVLFANARRKGATTLENCRVTNVAFDTNGETGGDTGGDTGGALVTARAESGEELCWRTKFVVDASGRDTFLANQLNLKKRNRKHNSAAIFGHFSGAQRLPGAKEGHISLFWFDHGWIWFIPLADGTTSVGAVCWPYYMKSRKTDPERFFFDTLAMAPALSERLRDAALVSPVTATGNYSYSARRTSGRSYLMLGDAFAFIDPVFSSGVFLAMQSGFVGADTIETCLDRPRAAARALKRFDANLRRGPKVFSWFIYRVSTPTLRDMFMGPRNLLRVQEAILSVLAGDIFRGTPIGPRILAFKFLYYLTSLVNPKRSVMAWKNRKRAIREPGVKATTI